MAAASPLLSSVSSAQSTNPPWEPDAGAAPPYGNIVFYDANGVQVTSGTDLTSPFAYAVGTTHSDAQVTKATVDFYNPGSNSSSNPALWTGTAETASTTFSTGGTSPEANLPAGTPADILADAPTYPVNQTSAADIASWIPLNTPSGGAYDNVINVRLYDSGPGGHGNEAGTYWSADIGYNTGSSSIVVDGTTVPADGWAQLFPLNSPPATATVLTTSATGGTLNVGNSITLSASTAASASLPGYVVFENNGTEIGDVPAAVGADTTYTYTPLGGDYAYTASFVPAVSGDESGANTASATQVTASTSSAADVTVVAPSTSTVISADPSSGLVAGQPVAYTATVTTSSGTPTGTVEFQNNGTDITGCSAEALSGTATDIATCTTSFATATSTAMAITGIYSGSTSFAGSDSSPYDQTVGKDPTTTIVSASPNPAGVGASVVITATVADTTGTAVPGGTVEFDSNGTAISGCETEALGSSSPYEAKCTTSTLAANSDSLTAIYSGDTNTTTSTSAIYSEEVLPATNTAVTASPTASQLVGEPVTYTATVTPAPTGSGNTVTFTDSGTFPSGSTCNSAATVTAGVATCTATYTSAGTHDITAAYSGNSSFGGSNGTLTGYTISQGTTTTAVSSGTNPSVNGQSVTFTATVTVATGAGTPSGAVTFTNGTATITCSGGNQTLSAGTATCTTSQLPPGSSSITAVYVGDTNFTGSTSPTPVSQIVNAASTKTVVTSSSSSILINKPVVYTAAVSASAPGSGTPTGTVSFTQGGSPISAACTSVTLTAGLATCTTTYTAGGTEDVTAAYTPASTLAYTASTNASPFVETVTAASPPGAPTALTATATNAGDGTVDLSWTTPASTGTSPIIGYDVFEGTKAGGESTTPVNSTPLTTTTAAINGLTDGDTYYFTVEAVNAVGASAASNEASATPEPGYIVVGSDGAIYSFGSNENFGSLSSTKLAKPIVGAVSTPDGKGYWLVASDGGVFSFGDAAFHGSLGNVKLKEPIVGISTTSDGQGYWLVAADGGVFAFGDATFHGSLGGIKLAEPVVGIVTTPDGKGYTLVASDGGVFAFGDATFVGSLGKVKLVKPIVGIVPTHDGKGYWMVASDGGVFAFGDAGFVGSLGGKKLAAPITAIIPTSDGKGYWMIATDGGVFAFGDATYIGSVPGTGSIIGGA